MTKSNDRKKCSDKYMKILGGALLMKILGEPFFKTDIGITVQCNFEIVMLKNSSCLKNAFMKNIERCVYKLSKRDFCSGLTVWVIAF